MKVERVKREVIEHRLLAALDDEDKVAILCSKTDVEYLINCLLHFSSPWTHDFLDGLETLQKEAGWKKA